MTIVMNENFQVSVLYGMMGGTASDGILFNEAATDADLAVAAGEEEMMNGEMPVDGMPGAEMKDPLLANWFFVGGISAASLIIGGLIGFLLARKKIKKGIELYED